MEEENHLMCFMMENVHDAAKAVPVNFKRETTDVVGEMQNLYCIMYVFTAITK